jgi:uncharacterized membrane protein YukC
MALNHDQQTQIDKQLEEHQHSKYEVDIHLDEILFLKDLWSIKTSYGLKRWLLHI